MLLALFRKLLATKYGHYILDVVLVVMPLSLGYGLVKLFNRTPDVQVVQVTPTTKSVYVDVPVLDEKTVTKYISNPKDKQEIQRLLAENRQLDSQVMQLSDTIATLNSHNSGPVVVVPPTAVSPAVTKFKDWRLAFQTDGKTAEYDLTQKFQVLSTTGRDKNGKGITLVNLFELGPDGQKFALSDVQTTAVFADETFSHWMRAPAVQAGIAMTWNNGSRVSGGLVGLQWLKRGRTSAAEDASLSLLTPVVFVANGVKEVGVLPMSFNLGSLRHQPLKDLWMSPYLGLDWTNRMLSRFGFSLTATF